MNKSQHWIKRLALRWASTHPDPHAPSDGAREFIFIRRMPDHDPDIAAAIAQLIEDAANGIDSSLDFDFDEDFEQFAELLRKDKPPK